MKNNQILIFLLLVVFSLSVSSCELFGTSGAQYLAAQANANIAQDNANIAQDNENVAQDNENVAQDNENVSAGNENVAQDNENVETDNENDSDINLPLQIFGDASGDEVVCGGSNTEDEVVDIRSINVVNDDSNVLVGIDIRMGKAPGSATSYSVVLFLKSDGQPLRAFIFEIHDGVKKIGEIDPSTFVLITPTTDVEGFNIFPEGVFVVFEFPDNFFPDGINDFFVQSFHMKSEGESTNCDEADASQPE